MLKKILSRANFIISYHLVIILAAGCAAAQDNTARLTAGNQVVTATTTIDYLRIASSSTIVQMHLEVYGSTGERVFDNEIRRGNVFDWHFQNGQAERLAAGDYLCVVTVKNIAGKLTQKIGVVKVGEKGVVVGPAESAQLTLPQSQVIGPIEENSSWTILSPDDNQTTTLIAHNGTDGQIVRGRGALSFRLGDFFSGNDREQMRLTEEGNLGLGTANPKFKLDVAGGVRARAGFVFNDGSILNVNEKGILTHTFADGTVTPSAAGTGTQGRLAKWTDNSGTLGDSNITEAANGFVGIGTSNPAVRLDVVDDTNGVGGFQLTNHTNGSLAQLQNRLANNAGALAYYGITSSAYTQAPILSNRAFFGSNAVDTVIWTQGANDILFATNGLSGAAERMRIKSSGNIGIGTSNPLREFQLGPSSDALFTFSPSDGSPNAGYIRFGDQTGWKLHFARSRESSGGPLNSETTGELMTIQDNGNVGIGTVSPQVKLEVRGDVKLGSGSQLFAPGGLENLRIIRGVVSVNGEILSGSGFSVTHPGSGIYFITFNTPFADIPAFAATAQMNVDGPDAFDTETVMTRDLSASQVHVRIRDPGQNEDSARFSFIVIGLR